MSHPSVSVVTPSYNQASFIRTTIESVRNQTYDDITHIVVDGESNDGTLDILRDYDSLHWTSEPDRGQTHAINKGFKRVDGDIIGWLNSDDPYVYRDTIATVVDAFEQTEADIVYGHAITIGPRNGLRRVHYIPEFDKKKLQRHCFLIQPSVFFKKSVIEQNRLNEDREYSMDYEFWLDLADDYEWHRLNSIVAADRNHQGRKIIQFKDQSRRDSNTLRRERGIDQGILFELGQIFDSLDLRWRRIKAIPHLVEIISTPSESFAFDLKRSSLISMLPSQVVGHKRNL
jgi:glycosyltransferase involved in cell wall biosynthesis